jgi:hypothetical protein
MALAKREGLLHIRLERGFVKVWIEVIKVWKGWRSHECLKLSQQCNPHKTPRGNDDIPRMDSFLKPKQPTPHD